MTSDSSQHSSRDSKLDPGVADALRELSGIDATKARAIAEDWRVLGEDDVLDKIVALRSAADADRSLEFDTIFRAGLTFPISRVRLQSVYALSSGGDIDIAYALIRVLGNDEASDVRAAAAEALKAYSDPSVTRSISNFTISRINAALHRAIDDETNLVRGKALISLSAMRYEDAPDLIDAVYDQSIDDSALMSDALLAMGESGDRAWLPTIEDAFYSNQASVRIASVLAFGYLAEDEEVDRMAEPFDDHVLDVQKATVQALERIGGEQAREMLSLAETSSEPEVQDAARTALEALKADDELIYAISPAMIERGMFGTPTATSSSNRDLARYDAPTEEGWANITSEGDETDVADVGDDIGEDMEDYLESEEFFRDSNTN